MKVSDVHESFYVLQYDSYHNPTVWLVKYNGVSYVSSRKASVQVLDETSLDDALQLVQEKAAYAT